MGWGNGPCGHHVVVVHHLQERLQLRSLVYLLLIHRLRDFERVLVDARDNAVTVVAVAVPLIVLRNGRNHPLSVAPSIETAATDARPVGGSSGQSPRSPLAFSRSALRNPPVKRHPAERRGAPAVCATRTWRTITAFLPAWRPCSMTTTFPDFKLRGQAKSETTVSTHTDTHARTHKHVHAWFLYGSGKRAGGAGGGAALPSIRHMPEPPALARATHPSTPPPRPAPLPSPSFPPFPQRRPSMWQRWRSLTSASTSPP